MLPVLVKLIAVLVHCGALDVNEAVGVWLILMVDVADAEQPLTALLTTSEMVLVPEVE